MKAVKNLLCGMILIGFCGGCATTGGDVSKVPEQFYGQDRYFTFFEVNNLCEFTLKGSNMTVKLSAPLDPLSMLPRDPNVAMQAFAVAKDILLGGMGIYYAADVMGKLTERPQVITQQVVRPEVVQVPAGAAVVP